MPCLRRRLRSRQHARHVGTGVTQLVGDGLAGDLATYHVEAGAQVRVFGRGTLPAFASQRQGVADSQYLNDGFMTLARLEIPRLDNDANFPEHGVLRFHLFGGQ